MKINNNYHEMIQGFSQARSPQDNKAADFSKMLDQASGSAQPQAAKPGLPAAGLLDSGLVGRILTGQAEAAQNPQAQLEQTLSAMEQYAEALADPRKSLKELAPLADEMEMEAGRLSKLSQSLSADNPLKGLANDASVLATVEAMKFKRGDFL